MSDIKVFENKKVRTEWNSEKEDDEDELTDEEIDRMIRTIE